MEIAIKAAQLLLSLSILVIFHELGHFLAAKAFKTRVEKFYLFFDAWFSLFKFKKGETEYGVGWIPLGGYVKIAGMIDESMDKEQLKQPAQPWEFRSKPAWQRLIIMLGGVTVNVLLAIGIYIVTLSLWGEEYLPASQAKYGITVDSLGLEMGLRNGDKIVAVNHEPVDDFFKIPAQIILEKASTIQVIRDGSPMDVTLPEGIIGKVIKSKSVDFINVRFPFEAYEFANNSAAREAGMAKGDRALTMDGASVEFFDQFKAEASKHKGQQVQLKVLRGSDTVLLAVKVSAQGTVGVATRPPTEIFKFQKHEYNLFQAIPAGTVKAFKGIKNYLKQLKLLFSPEVKAYESVGGFITIGKIFPSHWNWEAFWGLTAFLSIMLAILNVLPIPALDGGHVMFVLYEMITGRKPSDKFLEYAQITGMVILLSLLVFANGNDILQVLRKYF